MLQIEANNRLDNAILKCIDKSLTDKQRESINNRLMQSDIIPVSIYRHKRYNCIVLACLVKGNPDPIYYLYWSNGQELYKGYNFIDGKAGYITLINNHQEKVI